MKAGFAAAEALARPAGKLSKKEIEGLRVAYLRRITAGTAIGFTPGELVEATELARLEKSTIPLACWKR
jgi:hypothetical protein